MTLSLESLKPVIEKFLDLAKATADATGATWLGDTAEKVRSVFHFLFGQPQLFSSADGACPVSGVMLTADAQALPDWLRPILSAFLKLLLGL